VPMVNQEQIDGSNLLNDRGKRWIFMTIGHLKAGVTPAQAAADLNSIGSYLERTYPKDHGQMTLSDRQIGLDRQDWAADHCPGRIARRANCHMCRPGHFFARCRARTGTIASQQFRL